MKIVNKPKKRGAKKMAKKRSRKKSTKRRAVKRVFKRRSSRRKTPMLGGSGKKINLKPMVFGTLGIIGANLALSKLPIDPKFTNFARIGGGLLLSVLGRKKPMLLLAGAAIGATGIYNLLADKFEFLAGDEYTPSELEELEYYAQNQLAGEYPEMYEDDELMGNTEAVMMGNTEAVMMGEDPYESDY